MALLTRKDPPSKPSTVIEFDPVEWRARFDERAGSLEHDGGMSSAQASAVAGSEARLEWIKANMPESLGVSRCCHCGLAMDDTKMTMRPVGPTARVHSGCLVPFIAKMVKAATEAQQAADFPRAAQASPTPRPRIDELLNTAADERRKAKDDKRQKR